MGVVNGEEMDGDLRGKLRSVFDVCDVKREGYITVDHFKNLAKEHFGADSDEVRSKGASCSFTFNHTPMIHTWNFNFIV